MGITIYNKILKLINIIDINTWLMLVDGTVTKFSFEQQYLLLMGL